ncbi:hypothetical protein [Synechococcus sp. GEYO]|uniref:hypothetical protein n=1 Tax=Synechococcus sp. GEYO TaxID=2575511 RepID=UPI000E0EB7AC|nr:hypothetical protein [Synechococcus sp. GEYO]
MVLNRKGFFLELGEQEPQAAETKSEPKPEKVENAAEPSQPEAAPAPVEEAVPAPAVDPAPAPVAVVAESQAASNPDTTAKSSEDAPKAKPSLTTAEALAAELAAAEAAKPEIQLTTFAPDALQPGNSIRPGKRRPGNNLAGFRSMASELFKS